MRTEELKKIKTCDLVKELSRREGVEKIQIEGPATILVVID